MIYVVTGKNGHGKTAYGVRWCRTLLKHGETIYTNTYINPRAMFSKKKYKKLFGDGDCWGDILNPEDRKTKKILYWQNFSDWQYMKNGTIFCDEGSVYFNARRWESMPDTMQKKLIQHRKDKLDLIVTVPNYTFIDKTIRILCEKFINCELKIGSARFKRSILPRISRTTEIDIPTLNKCENLGVDPYNATEEDIKKYRLDVLYTSWFWIRSPIFDWYDTSIQMVESRPEKLIHLVRTCDSCSAVRLTHS